MDITSSSNIKQTVKMMSMQSTWNQKKTTEQAGFLGDEKLNAIITKMQSGQELSVADMEYLREKSPTTYDEAIKIEKEKKEYEKELRRCKTKEDARMLQLGKISEALSALKSGAADGRVVLAKLLKMTDAYVKFTTTKHYAKLAINHLELAQMEKTKQETKDKRVSNSNEKAKARQEVKTHDQEYIYHLLETQSMQKNAAEPERFVESAAFRESESFKESATLIKSEFLTESTVINDVPYDGESKIDVARLENFQIKSKLDRRA